MNENYYKPFLVGLVAMSVLAFLAWISPFLVFGAFGLAFAAITMWLVGALILQGIDHAMRGDGK